MNTSERNILKAMLFAKLYDSRTLNKMVSGFSTFQAAVGLCEIMEKRGLITEAIQIEYRTKVIWIGDASFKFIHMNKDGGVDLKFGSWLSAGYNLVYSGEGAHKVMLRMNQKYDLGYLDGEALDGIQGFLDVLLPHPAKSKAQLLGKDE